MDLAQPTSSNKPILVSGGADRLFNYNDHLNFNGIDPCIFFDDDGKVWYVGTHSPEIPNFKDHKKRIGMNAIINNKGFRNKNNKQILKTLKVNGVHELAFN